jgi:hypothetical protein
VDAGPIAEPIEGLLDLATTHLEGDLAHESGRVYLTLDAVPTLLHEFRELLDQRDRQAGGGEQHELEEPVPGGLAFCHRVPSSPPRRPPAALTRNPGTDPSWDRLAGWSA